MKKVPPIRSRFQSLEVNYPKPCTDTVIGSNPWRKRFPLEGGIGTRGLNS